MTDTTPEVVYRLRVRTSREVIYDISGATTPEEAMSSAMEYEQAYLQSLGELVEGRSLTDLMEVESGSMEDVPDDTLAIDPDSGYIVSDEGWAARDGVLWDAEEVFYLDSVDNTYGDRYFEDDEDAVLDRPTAATA